MFNKFYRFVPDDYFKRFTTSCNKMETPSSPTGILSVLVEPTGQKRRREDLEEERAGELNVEYIIWDCCLYIIVCYVMFLGSTSLT